MNECICSSCKNLKCNIPDETENVSYECEFGFPSENCISCEGTGCDIDCSHYENDEDEEVIITVNCKKCGKELKKAFVDDAEGDILCVDCYLES